MGKRNSLRKAEKTIVTILIVLLVTLLGCSRTEKEKSVDTVGVSETEKSASADTAKTTVSDFEASAIYSSGDSDSLLLDNSEIKSIVSLFIEQGTLVQNKNHSGGDCESKIRMLVYNGDTLTIEKYGCGEYGFGNSQYLTHDDSLKLVRQYTMEWLAESEKSEYKVTEKIYKFSSNRVTISERMKIITRWRDFNFVDTPFTTTNSSGRIEYMDLPKERMELIKI